MSIRRLERAIIKNRCYKRDGNNKNFRFEWEKYHNAKMKTRLENSNGLTTTVTRNKKIKKKNNHNNNKFIEKLKIMKSIMNNKKIIKAKTN